MHFLIYFEVADARCVSIHGPNENLLSLIPGVRLCTSNPPITHLREPLCGHWGNVDIYVVCEIPASRLACAS